jgi:hypothetical protein
MSHNIGSHVTPRATVEVVKRRLEELSLWPDEADDGLTIISELKGNLDEYAQRKADFLAEITTQPLMTTRPAYFYREVILPLIENSLMMDNIAANEGINYIKASDGQRGGVSNRLQLRVRINGKPLRAVYRCKSCTDITDIEGFFTYPTALPYSLTCPVHKDERLQIDTIENGEHDVEVELPGPLGEFAIYSFLENYIRNVAKHNKNIMGHGKKLKLTIDIDEVESDANPLAKLSERALSSGRHSGPLTQEQRDFYRIRVWDDIVDPDRLMNACVDGRTRATLQETVAAYADASIIQPDGSLKRQAWGIGEMKICAVLLSGPRNFVNAVEHKKLQVVKQLLGRSKPRMVYEFRLMKSKKICAILPAWTNEGMRLSLRDKGIWIYNSIKHLESELKSAESISSFHFVLFDCSESAGDEQDSIINSMEKILPHFPFRVLAFTGRGRLPEDLARLVQPVRSTFDQSRLRELHDRKTAEVAASEIYRWAWEHWIKWFLDQGPNARTAIVNVYLDQWEDEQPTKRWAQQADNFNKFSENVKIRVWGRFEGDNIWSITKQPSFLNVPTNIIYDRHGRLKGKLDTYLSANEDWSYVLLDKHSPDFTTLFTPRFPPLTQPGKSESAGVEHWTLPWEMAEAGLLRVLVIDERAAEFSLDELEHAAREVLWGLLRTSLGEKFPEDFNPVKWHMAWASKVYICTHFGVGREPEPLHDKIASRETNVPSLKVRVDIERRAGAETDEQQLAARIGFNIAVVGGEEKKFKADAILIHQGVLDEWRGEIRDQDVFLKSLRRHFPFVVVESGRGIPLSLSDTAKFLPFSLLQHSILGNIVGKFGLARVLMSLARRGMEGEL